MEYPIIAPFYADIDTKGVGQVPLGPCLPDARCTGGLPQRARTSAGPLTWCSSITRASLAQGDSCCLQLLLVREVVVVTWDQVGYFEEQADKVEHFLTSTWHECYFSMKFNFISWL